MLLKFCNFYIPTAVTCVLFMFMFYLNIYHTNYDKTVVAKNTRRVADITVNEVDTFSLGFSTICIGIVHTD